MLIISEIFLSIQGESTRAGLPCIMVRLAGCNLNCAWCDTSYARDSRAGEAMSIEQVMNRIGELGCHLVEVTGGEPLCQPSCTELLTQLCDAGYEMLLETNGTKDLSAIDSRVIRIMDVKCPSSGHDGDTRWENISQLKEADEVKFVLAGRKDYEFARSVVREHNLIPQVGAVIFSPIQPQLKPAELAQWILADALDVRLGLQLHKIIWPDKDRGR